MFFCRPAVLAVLLFSAFTWGAARAEVSSASDCQETTITALSEADAWVAENNTSNTGSDALLIVEAKPASGNSRALVRFRLPSGVPPGCMLESARLRLYTAAGSEGARVEAVSLASAWSEGSVSWSNQPETTGPAAATWSTDGYLRWNVTSQVQTSYDTGANHGFLIRDPGEGTDAGDLHGFNSKEKGENPPELVIRFAVPPTGESPAPPVPAAVLCGQVLTQSTLVTNDLFGCLGDGLVIGAPRIIVDLDGHTIDGVGLGIGILNDGYASVTVRNGTVEDFDYGIWLLPETSLNVVELLTLRLNQVAAIELFDAADNQILGNTLDQNGGGIDLVNGTTGTVVAGNTVTANGGAGLLLRDSDANRLEHNSVTGGGDLGIGLERARGNTVLGNMISGNSDGGIEISDGSHGNRIENNTLSESGDSGILVSESDHNQLIGNTSHLMSDSGIGLNGANDSVVRGNDVRFNSDGLQVEGSRNLIESNNASETTGNGIELAPGSFENHVVLNTANENSQAGIFLEGDAEPGLGNLIERNTASANRVAGIVAALGVHTITANVVRDNAGWGISALDSIDGGGNVATGNGEPAQCSGVVCRAEWVPPETTIGSGPDAATTNTSATFTFSASEPGSTFQCSLDTAAFAACTSPRHYTGLAATPHQFRVRATDPAGNVDATPASHSWTIQAASGCSAPTTTLTATADAWVDQSSPSNNKGTDSVLKVRSKGPAGNFRALVRFALPASVPAGCAVESATLRLYFDSANPGRTLQALRLTGSWTENGVTWANQPATAGTAASTGSGTGYREWNVASQVQAMYVAGASQGFLIRDATENQDAEESFHSREKGQNLPQLVIRFGPAGG